MHKHERLLHRILWTTGGLVIAYSLIAVGSFTDLPDTTSYFLSGMGLLCVVSLFSARWIFLFADPGGYMSDLESLPLLLLIWILTAAFMIVILPAALIYMIIKYWILRRRFEQENAGKSAG